MKRNKKIRAAQTVAERAVRADTNVKTIVNGRMRMQVGILMPQKVQRFRLMVWVTVILRVSPAPIHKLPAQIQERKIH